MFTSQARVLRRALLRSRGRTTLVMLQSTVAFMLFGLITGLESSVRNLATGVGADRLVVRTRASLGLPLPYSHLAPLERIPGVAAVSPEGVFIGWYQVPSQRVFAQAIDPAAYARANVHAALSAELVADMANHPTGILVGSETARRYGWRAGQRITVRSVITRDDGDPTWTFDVLGVLDGADHPQLGRVMLINYTAFDTARGNQRMVDRFVVRAASVTDALPVARAIDAYFENSAQPTRTVPELQFAQAQFEGIEDLRRAGVVVATAAFAALLLAASAGLIHRVRERRRELAILRAIGYPNAVLADTVLFEALRSIGSGAAIGTASAAAVLWLASTRLPNITLDWTVPALAATVAIGASIVTAAVPMRQVARLNTARLLVEIA